eukprot:jgi/Bigna1/131946/aug1.16_g6654
MAARPLACILLAFLATSAGAAVPRVLFVGNSFTFVNDMPAQIQNIATSLGDGIQYNTSTIGGCTLFAQTAGRDNLTARLLEEDWDFIVLQDYSLLPTVATAREKYLRPAVDDFIRMRRGGSSTKILLYLTWGYNEGLTQDCPTSDTKKCFPLGSLADLTEPDCTKSQQYRLSVQSFECMGYAVARGYLDTMEHFRHYIHGVVPAGLAWQVVRGSTEIPGDCKEAIDAEYGSQIKGNLTLPLRVPNASLPEYMLYRVYPDGNVDKHPNIAGAYLNALVFYASLFGKSPVGAAKPLVTETDFGDIPLTDEQALTLQTAAEAVVLQYQSAWHPH